MHFKPTKISAATLHQTQAGQTLIETVVAISILVIGLVTSLGLAIYSFQATDHSSKQVIGTALAREGVEAIKNVRDSFWLSDSLTNCSYMGAPSSTCYDHWLGTGNALGSPAPGTNYSINLDKSTGAWQVFANPLTFQLYYDSVSGQYNTSSSGAGVGVPALFYRRVNIIQDNTPPFNTAKPTRIIVNSTVWWSDRQCPLATDPSTLPLSCKVNLEMHLTNWRPY